jgi:hypothetical protein
MQRQQFTEQQQQVTQQQITQEQRLSRVEQQVTRQVTSQQRGEFICVVCYQGLGTVESAEGVELSCCTNPAEPSGHCAYRQV